MNNTNTQTSNTLNSAPSPSVADGSIGVCPRCGGRLIWDADYQTSEVGITDPDDTAHDDVVNACHCADCGSEFYLRHTAEGIVVIDVSRW